MDIYRYLILNDSVIDIAINEEKEGYVTLTEDGSAVDWTKNKYNSNGGLTDIVVTQPTPPTPYVPTKSEKLTQLKNEYDPQILSLQTQIAIAVSATKNTTTEAMYRNSLTALQAEYTAKRTAILHG